MNVLRYHSLALIPVTLLWLAHIPAASEESPPCLTTLLSDLSPDHRHELLQTLNAGKTSELTRLPGIEARRAEVLIRSRPIAALDDLMLLPGFGEKTVRKIILSVLDEALESPIKVRDSP